MQAVSATFLGLPAAHNRSKKVRTTGLQRTALTVAMDNTERI
jgi:hypothetical protein